MIIEILEPLHVLGREIFHGGEKLHFKNVCSDSLRGRRSCKQENNSTDTLFRFEDARLTYIPFQRLDISTISEISIMFVFKLGAGTNDAVDSLRPMIEQL